MDRVARMPARDRADLFGETGDRLQLDARVVEKDFWVCWTLKHLFSVESLGKHLLFKGGTSLSKVFGLIRRFSEDIDLAVDWEMLGFVGDRSPKVERNRSQWEKLSRQMSASSIPLPAPTTRPRQLAV